MAGTTTPDWFGWLGGYRYYFDAGVVLPPGSDARHLVAMMGGRHPGLQVVARATRIITSSAAGSIHAGWAVTKAGSEVVALNDGKGKTFVEHGIGCDLAGNPVDYGLLAGLGTGLGVPCPPGGVCQPDPGPRTGPVLHLVRALPVPGGGDDDDPPGPAPRDRDVPVRLPHHVP
jgi:hypothetical protein